MAMSPIKVFLVEDSPIALRILKQLIAETDDLELIGTAHNGQEAQAHIRDLQPHVLCTDLWMDGVDGAQLVQWTMAHCPCPIVVLSEDGAKPEIANQLKELGALAVLGKPDSTSLNVWGQTQLISTIKLISGVMVFTKPLRSLTLEKSSRSQKPQQRLEPQRRKLVSTPHEIDIVAMGVSTGGPKTIPKVLQRLPKTFPVPIVCTQHISAGFLAQHIQWLNRISPLKISIAQEGEQPQPGHVYYAPESFHLGITKNKKFWYDPAPPVEHHRPSVTVMFEAIAQVYGARSLGLQLTGMGRDGAEGLAAIARAGGITAAQNEASSVVFGMPKEAIAIGAAQHILDLENIPQFLWERVVAPRLKTGRQR